MNRANLFGIVSEILRVLVHLGLYNILSLFTVKSEVMQRKSRLMAYAVFY